MQVMVASHSAFLEQKREKDEFMAREWSQALDKKAFSFHSTSYRSFIAEALVI